MNEHTSTDLPPVNMDAEGNPTDGRGAWRQYLCRACGWIYDERLGDPDGGLPAGTRFEDIPDDWQCPLCGVTKRDFEPFVSRDTIITKPMINPVADEGGVIVIGGGTAGWTAIEALRKLDDKLPIMLITADSGDRYMKPQLSIAISQNKTPETLITKSAKELSEKLNIGLVAQTFVIHIDAKKRQVRTTRGNFYYQKLILALGATPTLPACLPPDCVWRINHIDMFAELQSKLSSRTAQHIAVIGAGMIGVEVAEDIVRAGHKVTLINRSSLPLAEILPKRAGVRLRDALISTGINYLADSNVTQLTKIGSNGGYKLTLDNGTTLAVDEVVASTGLALDERLPKRAGVVHSTQGISVDERTLKTSDPHIFAIGDCIAIGGRACRFVAPLREQANAIAHEIIDLEHAGYQHKPPMVRLKTKSIIVTLTGDADNRRPWLLSEETDEYLLMIQEKDGTQIAKLELKQG